MGQGKEGTEAKPKCEYCDARWPDAVQCLGKGLYLCFDHFQTAKERGLTR